MSGRRGDESLQGSVLLRVVGVVVVPEAPDDLAPRAAEDACGVGMTGATGASAVIDVCGPRVVAAACVGEGADRLAQPVVARPSELSVLARGSRSSELDALPRSLTSRRARSERATNASAIAAALASRCLCHALSCLAGRGGLLDPPDDAQAEPCEADVGRRTAAFAGRRTAGLPRAEESWLATPYSGSDSRDREPARRRDCHFDRGPGAPPPNARAGIDDRSACKQQPAPAGPGVATR